MSEPTVDLARRMPHPWSRDPVAQAAVRAAEDAAAAERAPLPDHRDLLQAVEELRERVSKLEQTARPCGGTDPASSGCAPGEAGTGLRTERVTLEITMPNGGREYHGDASSWDWTAILSHGKNFFGPGESVRVVEEPVEGAYGQASIDRLTAERDAAIRDLDGAMRGNTRLTNDAAALKARVAELENAAKAVSAANAGGEANQPWPMAFAVWGRGAVCGVSVSREDAGAMQREFAFDTEVRPLYAAPQPPRVKVPDFVFGCSHRDRDDAWVKAIREAGGEVAE